MFQNFWIIFYCSYGVMNGEKWHIWVFVCDFLCYKIYNTYRFNSKSPLKTGQIITLRLTIKTINFRIWEQVNLQTVKFCQFWKSMNPGKQQKNCLGSTVSITRPCTWILWVMLYSIRGDSERWISLMITTGKCLDRGRTFHRSNALDRFIGMDRKRPRQT